MALDDPGERAVPHAAALEDRRALIGVGATEHPVHADLERGAQRAQLVLGTCRDHLEHHFHPGRVGCVGHRAEHRRRRADVLEADVAQTAVAQLRQHLARVVDRDVVVREHEDELDHVDRP